MYLLKYFFFNLIIKLQGPDPKKFLYLLYTKKYQELLKKALFIKFNHILQK